MQATRPDPVFIDRFRALANNPTLKKSDPEVAAQARRYEVIIKLIGAVIAGAFVFAGVKSSNYEIRRGAFGLGAIAAVIAYVYQRDVPLLPLTEDDVRNATDGIVEGLNFYTRTKQDIGVVLFNNIDISNVGYEAVKVAHAALSEFENIYHGTAVEQAALNRLRIEITNDPDEDMTSYRKILIIANKFTVPKRLLVNLPPFLSTKLSEINDAVNIFINGKPPSQMLGNFGYLNLTVSDKKLTAKKWVVV